MSGRLVSLAGYSGVGKDTAAKNMPGWIRFAFADPLKADLLNLPPFNRFDLSDLEVKAKMRPLMVAYGAIARAFEPDYWLNRTMKAVEFALKKDWDVVITDCRYLNELRRVLAFGGKVIWIRRQGYVPANDEEARSFFEIETANLPLAIVWNSGTPEELGREVLEATNF